MAGLWRGKFSLGSIMTNILQNPMRQYLVPRRNPSKKKIGVQGACLELGQRKTGVADGPKKLRDTRFIEILRDVAGFDIMDYGDINLERNLTNPPGDMFLKNGKMNPTFSCNNGSEQNLIMTHRIWKEPVPVYKICEVGTATQAIADSTETILREGRVCLTLGGDHSIAIGTLCGTTRVFGNEFGVIWIDAHTDLNTPSTSNSGNLHGMALSFNLLDMIPYMTQLGSFKYFSPSIKSRAVVYIGLRDVEPFERAFVEKLNIRAFSMKEIDQIGMNGIIERTLDYLLPPGSTNSIHVSLDVDAIDPHDIPCTGTPVPGGLTLREGMHLLEEIEKTGSMVALDVVELNPDLGSEIDAIRSAQATEELIFSCFQYYRGGIASGKELPTPIPFNTKSTTTK